MSPLAPFDEPITAAVICLSQAWGGLEQVAVSDALDLAREGVFVRFLCSEGSPIFSQLQSHPEVVCVPLSFRPRRFFDFQMRSVIHREIKEFGVNLVHCYQTWILGSIAPWLLGYPKVALFASRQNLGTVDKRDFLNRMVYRRVDSLLVVSQSMRRAILETHPVKDRIVKVVNLGLDFRVFDPSLGDRNKQREAWGVTPDTTVIGWVGRADRLQSQDILIKAGAGLLKQSRLKEKVKFVVVAEASQSPEVVGALQDLREMSAQFRLEDSFLFLEVGGDAIESIVHAFDVLVLPSRLETFGVVAIEALAMECPVVLARGGSAEEVVGQEEFGLLVRPDDAFDLQNKLRILVDRPELRLQMGRLGRQYVRTHYDQRKRVERHLELYERALKRRMRT